MDIHKHDNKLCNRMEGRVTVIHQGAKTPSIAETKKHLAEHLKITEDVIAVKKILSDFGGGKAEVHFYAYHSPESYKQFEVYNKRKKAEATAPKK
ncbi:MAG: hypothetical protein Q7R96_06050 [Nanoarchaeota archaeon]|nr:hypothetical protein [Nanoarchaeota archaeon]